jgi:hypothetical protein
MSRADTWKRQYGWSGRETLEPQQRSFCMQQSSVRREVRSGTGDPSGTTQRQLLQTVVASLQFAGPLLIDTLEDAFRHRHPNFRPANDDEAVTVAA